MRNIVMVMAISFRDEKSSVMPSMPIIYLSRVNMSWRLDFKCSDGILNIGDARVSVVSKIPTTHTTLY